MTSIEKATTLIGMLIVDFIHLISTNYVPCHFSGTYVATLLTLSPDLHAEQYCTEGKLKSLVAITPKEMKITIKLCLNRG